MLQASFPCHDEGARHGGVHVPDLRVKNVMRWVGTRQAAMLNQAVALLPKRPTGSASTGGFSCAWQHVKDDYIYLSIPLVSMIKDADTALCFCEIRKVTASFRSLSAEAVERSEWSELSWPFRLAFSPVA